jgi:hypothetical protein
MWSLLLLHYQGHADSNCPSEDEDIVNILLGYVHAMRYEEKTILRIVIQQHFV